MSGSPEGTDQYHHLATSSDGAIRLPEHALERIQRATCFRKFKSTEVRIRIEAMLTVLPRLKPYRQPPKPHPKLKITRKRVGRLAKELHTAIEEFSQYFRYPSQTVKIPAGNRKYRKMTLAQVLDLLATISEYCNQPPLDKCVKRAPHRPRGSKKGPTCLVNLVELIERDCEGNLTLWLDPISRQAKGSLVTVLKILREQAPELVPSIFSYSTLRRHLANARTQGGDWFKHHRMLKECFANFPPAQTARELRESWGRLRLQR